MNPRVSPRLAAALLTFTAVAGGAFASACSSSSSNAGGPGSSADSGLTDGTMAVEAGSDAEPAMDSGVAPESGVVCPPTPVLGATPPAGSIPCGPTHDGGTRSCSNGRQCCLGGPIGFSPMLDADILDPDQCGLWTGNGAGCTNPPDAGIGIACTQVADCTANAATGTLSCCLVGATLAQAASCGGWTYVQSLAPGAAVVCESPTTAEGGTIVTDGGTGTCNAGETQLCQTSVDCPPGKTCTAMQLQDVVVGFCQ
jgi:hypothetical protein